MKRTCQCAHITSCIYTEDAWVLLFIFRSLPIVGRYRRLTLTVAFGLLSGGSDFSSKAPSDMGDEEKPVSLPIEQYFGSFDTHANIAYIFSILSTTRKITCGNGHYRGSWIRVITQNHPIPPHNTPYHPIPPHTTLYHPYTIPIPSPYHPHTIPIPPKVSPYHPHTIPIPPHTTLYRSHTILYHDQFLLSSSWMIEHFFSFKDAVITVHLLDSECMRPCKYVSVHGTLFLGALSLEPSSHP